MAVLVAASAVASSPIEDDLGKGRRHGQCLRCRGSHSGRRDRFRESDALEIGQGGHERQAGQSRSLDDCTKELW